MPRVTSYIMILVVGNFATALTIASSEDSAVEDSAFGSTETEEFEDGPIPPSSCLLPCLERCSVVYDSPLFKEKEQAAKNKGGTKNKGLNVGNISGKVSNKGSQIIGSNAKFSGGISNGKRDTTEAKQTSSLVKCYDQCSVLFGDGVVSGGDSGENSGESSPGTENFGINVGDVAKGGEVSNEGVQVIGEGANFNGGISNDKPKPSPASKDLPTTS